MTCEGGSTFCICTCWTSTPDLYSSSVFCINSCTAISILLRAPVRIGWISERPMTSRIALSATAFTVVDGFWMLNR